MQPLKIFVLTKEKIAEYLNEILKIENTQMKKFGPWNKKNLTKDIESKFELSAFANVDKNLVGYIIASKSGNICHIHRIAIDRKYTGRSIGSKLIKFVEKLAINKSLKTIEVETLRQENLEPFYFKSGFSELKGDGLEKYILRKDPQFRNLVRKRSVVFQKKLVRNYHKAVKTKGLDKVISVHQPNFMPWLGLLEKIKRSDIFVVFDTSKVGKNSPINRNLIKTPQGPIWLTVPVHVSINQEFKTIKIDNSFNWRENHLKSLYYNYKKAPNFDLVYPKIEKIYLKKYNKLIDLNMAILKIFLDALDIKVKFVFASDLKIKGEKNETLIGFIKKVGGKTYLAGDGSKAYLDESLFEKEDIKVIWQNFKHPTYKQLWGKFTPKLSAIDYLMCDGRKDIFR